MSPEQELDALKSWPDEEVSRLLAGRVRELRRDAGHSQEVLAQLANVSLRTYKRFEADGNASLETFVRILRALNRVEYLHLLLPPPAKSRIASSYEEKLVQAKIRWQKPDGR